MEQIGATLKPYSAYFQNIVIALSVVRFAMGLSFFKHLQQEQSTNTLTLKGLLGGLVVATINMRLAQMSNSQLTYNIQRICVIFLTGYLALYHMKAVPELKHYAWQKVPPVLGLIALCMSYSYIDDVEMVKWNLSLIRTATSSMLIITALFTGTGVLSDCSVSAMMSFSRLLYDISTNNTYMIYHSILLFSLDILRLYKCLRCQACQCTDDDIPAHLGGTGKPPTYIFMLH